MSSIAAPPADRIVELPDAEAVHDDLRAAGSSAYDEVLADAARDLGRLPGVRLAYVFGGRSCPGVSDIDMLVICDDAAHAAVTDGTRAFIDADPLRRYLFAHQMFVLPASLAPLRTLLFLKDEGTDRRVLFGDEALLRCPPLSPEALRLQCLVWQSALWRTILQWRSRPFGVRELMLTMQTFSRQIADMRWMHGRPADAEAALAESLRLRRRILADAGATRIGRLLSSVQLLQERWLGAQWSLQSSLPLLEDPRPLLLGGRTVTFARTPGQEHALPAMHAAVGAMLREVLQPALNRDCFTVRLDLLPQPLRDAGRTYAGGLRQAVSWGLRHADNPFALFLGAGGGIFPVPFNLTA